MRVCAVAGCDRRWFAGEYCQMHYSRWKRHGDPLVVKVKTAAGGFTEIDRFLGQWEERHASEVPAITTPCWVWTRGKNDNGYGVLRGDDGKNIYAHRFSYEFHVAQIDEGLQIDHLCRVTSCVNPTHLEPVTPGENTRRGIIAEVNRERAARITSCPSGHEYSPENTYTYDGRRHCITCLRESTRRWRATQQKEPR